MKSFKQFLAELYQEESDSTFTHNGIEYNLNKLFKLTEFTDVKMVAVDKLKWILKYFDHDKSREKKSDPSIPILITKSIDGLVTLDGMHRLKKDYDSGVKEIPTKYVTPEMLSKVKL